MSNKTLSQQILDNTTQTAADTKAIRHMLEEHLGKPKEPRTEQHDNLEQFVMEMPGQLSGQGDDEPGHAGQNKKTEQEHAVTETGQAGQSEKQHVSARERLLANFKKRMAS